MEDQTAASASQIVAEAKTTNPTLGRIISIRHPGYDDEHNTLLKLYAYDHPEGGIHYETVRIACGMLAGGNRWDGILTSSPEYHDESAPLYGVFIGKNCYFHLLDWQPHKSSDNAQAARRYPIICRLEEWTFPHGNLPRIWQDVTFAAISERKVVDDSGLKNMLEVLEGLLPFVPSVEEQVGGSLAKLREMATELNVDTDICQLCGGQDGSFIHQTLSGGADYKWFMRNSMHRYLCDAPTESEDYNTISGGEQTKQLMNRSLKNKIKLGVDCQAERHDCKVTIAMLIGQFSFAPKFEQYGKLTMVAALFAPGDTTGDVEIRHLMGISNARDYPLINIHNISTEMIFTRFALNVFWNLNSFLDAGVVRKLYLTDQQGRTSTFDAHADLCTDLTTRMDSVDEDLQETSKRFNDSEWDLLCDGCHMNFYGLRYKCIEDENFNYCSYCIEISNSEHPGHPFVAIFQQPKLEQKRGGN